MGDLASKGEQIKHGGHNGFCHYDSHSLHTRDKTASITRGTFRGAAHIPISCVRVFNGIWNSLEIGKNIFRICP